MGVGKWVKKGVVSFAMASTNVEKQVLSQSSDELDAANKITNPYHRNQLMSDLKEGRMTQQVQEFRKHHYQVLQASEKFKGRWGRDGDFKMLTEQEISQNKVTEGDPYDTYKVEVTIDNSSRPGGLLTEETIQPIKVRRGVFPDCKIEEHSHQVHVRDIDGSRKLIDFYIEDIPKNRRAVLEARDLMNSPGIRDFNNITNMNFTTPGGDMLMFEYKMLAFDKVVQYNGNYIVKMFAEVTKNGEWAAEKFMLTD